MRPQAANLDRQFFALADGTRRGMIDRLARGPASVSELIEPFEIGMPTALKHLSVLEEGGLVESEKQGRVRTYRLVPGAFTSLEQWVGMRQSLLNAQFDRLGSFLAGSIKEKKK